MEKTIKTMYVPSFDGNGMDVIYIGSPDDIKAMYKSIDRANRKCKTDICPLILKDPIFNPCRSLYGLRIDNHGLMSIVRQDTIASWMFSVMEDGVVLDWD